jgi:hypothetical protein
VTFGDGDFRTAVGKLGGDVFVRVGRVLGLDGDRVGTTNSGGVDGEH